MCHDSWVGDGESCGRTIALQRNAGLCHQARQVREAVANYDGHSFEHLVDRTTAVQPHRGSPDSDSRRHRALPEYDAVPQLLDWIRIGHLIAQRGQ